MLYIDKFTPTNINDSGFHKELLKMLAVMSKDESVPHMIFHGPEGVGKKTIIKQLLEQLYDKNVHETCDAVYNVVGSGHKEVEVTVKQSDYHIIIEPNNNNFDRYLIQDIVKEYAKKMPLNIFTTNKIFKTVLINNVDNLSYYAQTSLRRTMEKYSNNCRFIMWCRSLSKVIEPLRSRCVCFRVNSPSRQELFDMVHNVSVRENIELTLKDREKILSTSKGNIKIALWMLQLHKEKYNKPTIYQETIKALTKLIIEHDITTIPSIRILLYNIIITNFPGSNIVNDLLLQICNSNTVPDIAKFHITESAARFEHNLVRSRREIIHLEGFIVQVMKILHDNEKLLVK
jgi:replication factor C subunit 3/5